MTTNPDEAALAKAVDEALSPTDCPMDADPALATCPHAACWLVVRCQVRS